MKNYIRTLHSPVLTAVCPLMEDVCLTAVCPPMSINIYTYMACLYRFAVRTSFTSKDQVPSCVVSYMKSSRKAATDGGAPLYSLIYRAAHVRFVRIY